MTTPETGPAPAAAPAPDAAPEAAPPVAPEAGQPVAPEAAQAAPPTAPPAGGRRPRGAARTYDFRRPTKLSREHVRILQIAQENFARQATTTLTSMLRTGARMELVGIEQFSYYDYVATLPPSYFLAVSNG